jgi:hypothetical protein
MEVGGPPEFGVCAAMDVHYLKTGGAQAAAVLAADAAFARVLAETHRGPTPGAALAAGRVLPARAPRRCARPCTL